MNIPTREECLDILNNNKTPFNVIEHSKAVAEFAEGIVEKLIKNGIKVNKKLVIAAALLHDIEREKKNHVIEGANLLKKLGFPEVAEVVKKHSLYQIEKKEFQPHTIEEKIVFYADKRIKGKIATSLKERFDDLKERYDVDLTGEFKLSKRIEEELNQ